MPVFQDDFVNHMGLFAECGSERIEKCFPQTSQTLSNSVPISISSVKDFLFSWFSLSDSCMSTFCFVLFHFRQNLLYSHRKIFISLKLFSFYCDNSVRLWAIWMLWMLSSSQRAGAQSSQPGSWKKTFCIDHTVWLFHLHAYSFIYFLTPWYILRIH